MKINMILPFTYFTGGIKVALEYSNRLKNLGHDVIVYFPMKAYGSNNNNRILEFLKILKGTIGNTFKRGRNIAWFNLKCESKLVPAIKDKYIRDADISIATAWPTAFDVYNLNDNKGKKIYFIQGYEIWSGNKKQADKSYQLDLNQIVIAKWLKDLMKEKFNKDASLIYNGIDKEEFISKEKLINDNLVFCMLYHKLECKGFNDGLKAFEMVKKKYPNISLKLFGLEEGDNIPKYAEFYKNPSKETIKEIYCSSDIYIFPSRNDGWGLTVIEAMACKCAVVGTKTGALDEIGIDMQNCLISNTEDVEGLANNLFKLVENRDLLRKVSENGYNAALNFNWDNSVNKLEALFNELVCNNSNSY